MWLHVANHWLNMAHALLVDVDDTSVPPTVSIVFPDGVKRTFVGVDRMDILEHLEQESRLEPYVLGDVLTTLDPPAPYISDDSKRLELHITAPDVSSFRDTMQAMMEAVLREARTPQVFSTTQAAIDYAIRSEGD
jgi:hypothetical protein